MNYLLFGIFCFMFATPLFSSIEQKSEEKPFFQAALDHPYHVSIGAVLFDREGRIACHHFKEVFGHQNIYILMRESMENEETPLMALHRGLKEEFGATAQPLCFLGCLSGSLPDCGFSFEKTTLYIACQLIEWKLEDRDPEDPEASSIIEWIEPNHLIALMSSQGLRFPQRVDADESEIIRRAIQSRALKKASSGLKKNVSGLIP
jgi:8-oxo-dGTP pyrophosphatase MutT (NUDIX family)